MQTGKYRVFAGETPFELLDVVVCGHLVSIQGDIWTGAGRIDGMLYNGDFQDRVGGGHGIHHGEIHEDGTIVVEAWFAGAAAPIPLTWRREQ